MEAARIQRPLVLRYRVAGFAVPPDLTTYRDGFSPDEFLALAHRVWNRPFDTAGCG